MKSKDHIEAERQLVSETGMFLQTPSPFINGFWFTLMSDKVFTDYHARRQSSPRPALLCSRRFDFPALF